MKQPQPATTGPAQPPGPPLVRETATGFSDTWNEANIWQTRTFTAESRWGVRYTQSDPVELALSRENLFTYAAANPLLFVDPLGLLEVYHASACAERYIGALGGVNEIPGRVGRYLDRRIGNNLIAYCARCRPDSQPSDARIVPSPVVGTGDPVIGLLPSPEGVVGADDLRVACGGCNNEGERFFVANVRTRSALTRDALMDKVLFYSLEYKCCGGEK